MTKLLDEIKALIKQRGPITVEQYMQVALNHPEHGYYMNRDPFGAAGDFTTAPEISQMFGELLGLWCAEVWASMGSPRPTHVVELGRGELLAQAELPRQRERVGDRVVHRQVGDELATVHERVCLRRLDELPHSLGRLGDLRRQAAGRARRGDPRDPARRSSARMPTSVAASRHPGSRGRARDASFSCMLRSRTVGSSDGLPRINPLALS